MAHENSPSGAIRAPADGRTDWFTGGADRATRVGGVRLSLTPVLVRVPFEKLEKAVHPDYLLSNASAPSGIHLSAEEYGRDRIVVGHWSKAWGGAEDSAGLIDDLGLSEGDTRKLKELAGGQRDFLEGLSSEERLEYVGSTSYATFLSERVGLSRAAATVFEPTRRALFGVGIESISVREAVLTGTPGPNPLTGQPAGAYEPGQYPAPRYPMFPDGNASVARLFVRKLIPAVAPDPDGPLVVFMGNAPAPENNGGQTGRDLYRKGRRKLFETPFSTYERQIERQLTSMFGDFGFDADRHVEAITVNRWPHGYAYGYMDLYDPDWPAGEAPHELGRKPFGRVSIANSDAEALAYVQGAIDAAWRAVEERLNG